MPLPLPCPLRASLTASCQIERIIHIRNHILVMMPLLGRSASALQTFAAPVPISDRAAAVIALSVLSAVAALSQLKLCHGDIKPSNIMLHTHLVGVYMEGSAQLVSTIRPLSPKGNRARLQCLSTS